MDMLRNRPADPEASIRASIPVGYAATTSKDRIEEDVRRRLANPTSPEGYAGQLMGGLGYAGTLHRLPNLEIPVLVITGDQDKMVPPENAEILAGAIKDVRLIVVPGAGHVIFTDAPEALTDAMLPFYGEVEGSHDRSR
jgi:pimeloyl-ACP methyl ester carboxylesterase